MVTALFTGYVCELLIEGYLAEGEEHVYIDECGADRVPVLGPIAAMPCVGSECWIPRDSDWGGV